MLPEHVDVVVVGAGLSGIDAAYHLQTLCPDRSYLILEARADLGGTWDLFKYPGVRSDSDMYTLGFGFKPWTAPRAIADGPAILAYLRETVAEFGIERHIHFRTRLTRAEWSSDTARWTLTVSGGTGPASTMTCGFRFMCSGYYSYEAGYTPEFPGRDRFRGTIVHPQAWPVPFDYSNRRIVVIGSGATAVTLVPALTDRAAHVTMLQRSPTYIVAWPDEDRIANALARVLPRRWAYRLTRWKNIRFQQAVYARTRTQPDKIRKLLLDAVRTALGPDYDVDTHFTPRYNPWDQRLCLVPNGDLFNAIRSGKASMVTDQIETFTETGIALRSGAHLDADIIVTATGLNVLRLGAVDFAVDGAPVDFAKTWTYKGVAFSDVPNLVMTFGYINASWTLRADLISEYVCRLLNHMTGTGTDHCTPRLRDTDREMPSRPWIDQFSSGYVQRALHLLPRQGDREPWINPQTYARDQKLFRTPVDDGVMRFTRARSADAVTPLA
jgi:cation diffusion facilitator CzcD-associated flavoprotein CzcO